MNSLIEDYWTAFDAKDEKGMLSAADKMSIDELNALMANHYDLATGGRLPLHAKAHNILGAHLKNKIEQMEAWLDSNDREYEYCLQVRDEMRDSKQLTEEQKAFLIEFEEKMEFVASYRLHNF